MLYCSDKAPHSFNPQISHDVATLDATTHQLYNRLVKIDPISQRFVSDIALRWEVNSKKTEYTFYLRRDVNFHHNDYFTPSRQLNAEDVIFSFDRMLAKEHPFHLTNVVAETYLYNHPFSNLVADIVKVDDYTIRFMLNKSDATLLANLAAHYAVIHSKEYAQLLLENDNKAQIDYLPIGTGPYQFKQNSTKRLIRFQAHTKPWEKPSNIKQLIFDVTPNSTKRYAKLLSGECDIITNPAPSQVKQISKNELFSLSSQPTGNVALIAFNTKSKSLQNSDVRHALSSAIDRQTILDAVYFENATAANNLLPSNSWAYNPRAPLVYYTPEHSREKLQNGEFDFSQTLRIVAPIKSSIFNPNFYKTAELIQSNLATIGVNTEIIQLRNEELNATLMAGEYDLYLTGISPYIKDPDNLFRPLFSCSSNQIEGNTGQWCDTKVQALLDNTLLETNFVQRVKNYYQLQEYTQDQLIYLPIAHLLRFDVFNNNISGLQMNPLTGIDLHSVNKVPPLTKEQIK
ncbi:ABC transporter substrate-binding protein [Psychromonas marina]|uniref:ABC transporter substrate-binding protein n=1 Tax=Psychromonas marina TaxID=88364 RepID=A0ABQ6E1X2_9GAMM|nr:ABC transporter substrate-binding protein [Psychromonas marina]